MDPKPAARNPRRFNMVKTSVALYIVHLAEHKIYGAASEFEH
jgi:hypothetical protein